MSRVAWLSESTPWLWGCVSGRWWPEPRPRALPPPRARPLLGAAERGWTAHTPENDLEGVRAASSQTGTVTPEMGSHFGDERRSSRGLGAAVHAKGKAHSPWASTARIGLVQEITPMGLFNNRAAGCPEGSWALSQEFPGWLVARRQGQSQGRVGLGEQVR